MIRNFFWKLLYLFIFIYLFIYLFFWWGREGGGGGGASLSPPRLNIFTVGNMGVMICLGQRGLRSRSTSSLHHPLHTKATRKCQEMLLKLKILLLHYAQVISKCPVFARSPRVCTRNMLKECLHGLTWHIHILCFYLQPVFEKRREVLFWGLLPSPPSKPTFCLISQLLL